MPDKPTVQPVYASTFDHVRCVVCGTDHASHQPTCPRHDHLIAAGLVKPPESNGETALAPTLTLLPAPPVGESDWDAIKRVMQPSPHPPLLIDGAFPHALRDPAVILSATISERNDLLVRVKELDENKEFKLACYKIAIEERDMARRQRDSMRVERDAAISRVNMFVAGAAKDADELSQIVGRVLGYPRYADDQQTFPGATGPDVCVGDQVPVTLAMQAAREIERLKVEIERLHDEPRLETVTTTSPIVHDSTAIILTYEAEAAALRHANADLTARKAVLEAKVGKLVVVCREARSVFVPFSFIPLCAALLSRIDAALAETDA